MLLVLLLLLEWRSDWAPIVNAAFLSTNPFEFFFSDFFWCKFSVCLCFALIAGYHRPQLPLLPFFMLLFPILVHRTLFAHKLQRIR